MAYPVYSSNGGVTNAFQAASINATFPGTINAGDFLVMFSSKDMLTNNAITTHPAGFSTGPVRISSYKGSYALTTAMYYKRADGTESGTVNMVWQAAAYNYCTTIMYRFTAVVGGGFPFDFSTGGVSTGASSTYIQSGGTTIDTERLLLGYTILYSSSTANTAAGWISRHTNNSAGYYHKMQDRQVATAQTVSDTVGSITGTTSHWISNTFALKPGAGWPHKFLGVDNFEMGKISGVSLEQILAVNDTT
ncbi:hypothetical protein LCGC14_0278600 [marine sediment metagenome]|uniref:Uncharacterized protein n=1 Tax=marine sediment metagenome TaxID=412755 RepID=A0A0F9UDS0_9ZZZZ